MLLDAHHHVELCDYGRLPSLLEPLVYDVPKEVSPLRWGTTHRDTPCFTRPYARETHASPT